MSHEVETMAWAHEVPWHGLGNRVEESVTIEEMLVAAGLDWTVDQYDCFTRINGVETLVGRKALVRSKDNKVMTVSGDNWRPFQNKEAMEFFREYCATGGATLETAGALRGGRIIWALARVAAGFSVNGKRDNINAYILLVWSHEAGIANTARVTTVRVVCANTLAMAGGVKGKNATYRQSHIRPFDIAAAKETIQLACDNIEQMRTNAEQLIKLKMSEYDTVEFLARYYQPMTEEELAITNVVERTNLLINDPKLRNSQLEGVLWATEKAPGAVPGNAWGLLNGVTYWSDHMAGRSGDARLFSSWLGNNSRRKEEIHHALLEMAA